MECGHVTHERILGLYMITAWSNLDQHHLSFMTSTKFRKFWPFHLDLDIIHDLK